MILRFARRLSLTNPILANITANMSPSMKDAVSVDSDGSGTISRQELATYIQRNAKLWAMLAVNLNLDETTCRNIATHVAYQLAKNITSETQAQFSEHDKMREPTVAELCQFLDFVKTPTGEQEFFHRTVFQAFDADDNGYLDYDELDKFLNVFYETNSIFAGDARLPPKFVLKMEVLVELDANGDGLLTFPEIRSLISGGARGMNKSHSNSKTAAVAGTADAADAGTVTVAKESKSLSASTSSLPSLSPSTSSSSSSSSELASCLSLADSNNNEALSASSVSSFKGTLSKSSHKSSHLPLLNPASRSNNKPPIMAKPKRRNKRRSSIN